MLPSVLVRTARDQRRSVTVWAAALVGDGATLLDSHITIVNAAVGVDGRRGALGWNPPCSPGLGSPGTSTQPALRRRMVQRLGLEWDQPINGTADLAGVPRGVRRALLPAPPPGPRVHAYPRPRWPQQLQVKLGFPHLADDEGGEYRAFSLLGQFGRPDLVLARWRGLRDARGG